MHRLYIVAVSVPDTEKRDSDPVSVRRGGLTYVKKSQPRLVKLRLKLLNRPSCSIGIGSEILAWIVRLVANSRLDAHRAGFHKPAQTWTDSTGCLQLSPRQLSAKRF